VKNTFICKPTSEKAVLRIQYWKTSPNPKHIKSDCNSTAYNNNLHAENYSCQGRNQFPTIKKERWRSSHSRY